MLSHNQILVFEDLRVLIRKSLNQLKQRILYLVRKVAKHKFILNHKLIQRIRWKLNLKWKVVFNWSHFSKGKKFV